jgi:hypothetical protein
VYLKAPTVLIKDKGNTIPYYKYVYEYIIIITEKIAPHTIYPSFDYESHSGKFEKILFNA